MAGERTSFAPAPIVGCPGLSGLSSIFCKDSKITLKSVVYFLFSPDWDLFVKRRRRSAEFEINLVLYFPFAIFEKNRSSFEGLRMDRVGLS